MSRKLYSSMVVYEYSYTNISVEDRLNRDFNKGIDGYKSRQFNPEIPDESSLIRILTVASRGTVRAAKVHDSKDADDGKQVAHRIKRQHALTGESWYDPATGYAADLCAEIQTDLIAFNNQRVHNSEHMLGTLIFTHRIAIEKTIREMVRESGGRILSKATYQAASDRIAGEIGLIDGIDQIETPWIKNFARDMLRVCVRVFDRTDVRDMSDFAKIGRKAIALEVHENRVIAVFPAVYVASYAHMLAIVAHRRFNSVHIRVINGYIRTIRDTDLPGMRNDTLHYVGEVIKTSSAQIKDVITRRRFRMHRVDKDGNVVGFFIDHVHRADGTVEITDRRFDTATLEYDIVDTGDQHMLTIWNAHAVYPDDEIERVIYQNAVVEELFATAKNPEFSRVAGRPVVKEIHRAISSAFEDEPIHRMISHMVVNNEKDIAAKVVEVAAKIGVTMSSAQARALVAAVRGQVKILVHEYLANLTTTEEAEIREKIKSNARMYGKKRVAKLNKKLYDLGLTYEVAEI